MRRFLSMLLLLVFGLPVVAPLLASGQDAEASLPACCRRNGAHHCAMGLQAHVENTHRVSAPCPHMRQPATAAPHLALAHTATAQSTEHDLQPAALVMQHTEANRRISRDRSRHKRGPPSALPSV